MAGRPLGSAKSGSSETMGFQCPTNPPLPDPTSRPSWNGWSPDLSNTRFQPANIAKLTPAQVPKLKLKWVFGFPSGVSANAQPTIVSGRVLVGSDNGYVYVYSIHAKSGCVYWSFETGSYIRNSIMVGPVKNSDAKYAAFVGDGHANVYAINAQNGQLLWKTKVDPHFVARITAGIKYYDNKVIVPVSSSEEFSSGNPGYSCCTSRGSVVALDASTGTQIWKAWVVPDEPKPYKTMANGVVLYAPAGGAVWNSPTIDPMKRAVYFGTGDATAPSPKTTDAIMAVDLDSGQFLWAYQATESDVFMGGCDGPNASEACPKPMGPDMDIGNSPILKTLQNGKRVLIAGTKSADIFAPDPDDNGKLLYRVHPLGLPLNGNGRGRSSIVWGGAADDKLVYYGIGGAGLAAVQPATGEPRGCSRLSHPRTAAAAARRSAPLPRPFPAMSSKARAMARSTHCRRRTVRRSGSIRRRKSSRRSTAFSPRTAARSRHQGQSSSTGWCTSDPDTPRCLAHPEETSCSRSRRSRRA
jgi:polyvinyl alcohol dehydrogenase (cytochrome)